MERLGRKRPGKWIAAEAACILKPTMVYTDMNTGLKIGLVVKRKFVVHIEFILVLYAW
jgi:hypothetical protein